MSTDSAKSIALFVYGTLMRGESNHRHMAGCAYVQPARTVAAYTLVDLGSYPALLSGGDTAVEGELFLVPVGRWGALDEFEGASYARREVALVTPASDAVQAYFLTQRPSWARVIASGSWKRRL